MRKTEEEIISKPSQLIIFLRGIVNAFRNNDYPERKPMPKIGSYFYDAPITKEYNYYDYLLGIYKNKNGRVFIKTWAGDRNSTQYHFLKNEYRVCQLLYKKLRASPYDIRVPRPIEWIENENYTAAVFEVINGEVLSKFPLEFQTKQYKKILLDLQTVSRDLTKDEKAQYMRRTFIFYFFSLVYFSFVSLMKSPRLLKTIVSLVIESLINLNKIKKGFLILTHRDLSTGNIMIYKNKIYLLDAGLMTLTYDGFDLANAYLFSQLKLPLKQLETPGIESHYVFFTHYIILHRYIKQYLENPERLHSSIS